MPKQNTPALKALKRYIKAEMDGHQFYKLAAERTKDARGKEMFSSLANDELEHATKLTEEYESLLNAGPWLSLRELIEKTDEAAEKSIFPVDRRSVGHRIREDASDLDALEVAIGMEKESYEQYARAAAEASDPAAEALFEHLMKEEEGHLNLLRSSYEYLRDTGAWFQLLERPIFEG